VTAQAPQHSLTHLDADGAARMVDVSLKDSTLRTAVATGTVLMSAETLALLTAGAMAKGDTLSVARIAGILAAKRTGELIPLCHPIGLEQVSVDLTPAPPNELRITASTKVRARTGVEMEALTAVSMAALTVYDMCKAVDREMVITDIRLEEKTGGRSGHFRRADTAADGHTAYRPVGQHDVVAYLMVPNVRAIIDFYVAAFDAAELLVVQATESTTYHAEVRIGDTIMALHEALPGVTRGRTPRDLSGTTVTFTLWTDNVDTLFQRAVAAGATVDAPPDNAYWGDRTARVTDPAGHGWTLATRLREVSLEEQRRGAAAHFARHRSLPPDGPQ
jgi:cyclic pyranopterin phosphate synthase